MTGVTKAIRRSVFPLFATLPRAELVRRKSGPDAFSPNGRGQKYFTKQLKKQGKSSEDITFKKNGKSSEDITKLETKKQGKSSEDIPKLDSKKQGKSSEEIPKTDIFKADVVIKEVKEKK